MIERKIIAGKKDEFAMKEYVKAKLGKGKVSDVRIERTPIGEKIIVVTTKPGLIIGRAGETIQELTRVLKKQFKLENPKVDVEEVQNPDFDAKTIADQLALTFERFGPETFKMRAYKVLERLKEKGALGAEIILSGKLPSEKARSWRFTFGYLKKTGEIKMVNRAQATAKTKPGIVGIKVEIVPKDAVIPDKIIIPDKEIKEITVTAETETKAEETKTEEKVEQKAEKEKTVKKRGRKKKDKIEKEIEEKTETKE